MSSHPSASDTTSEARNLKNLLPDGVRVIFSEARHATAELHPLEQEFLHARRMQPVREREFRLGRAVAREALAQLGISGYPLLPAETREPLWPAGVVGSISHSEGNCAVAVAAAARFPGLGVDLESIGRIDDSIADTICTQDERRELNAMPPSLHRQRLSLLFSAKESVFKALFPSTRQLLEFDDVSIVVHDGRFTARPVRPDIAQAELLNGRFSIGPHLILTAAWLPVA